MLFCSHDSLHQYVGTARIVSIDSGTLFTVDTDQEDPTGDNFFSVTNVFDLEDVLTFLEWQAHVRNPVNNMVTQTITNYNTSTRQVTVADTSDMSVDDLVAFGPTELVTERVQVINVEPAGFDTAQITARPLSRG